MMFATLILASLLKITAAGDAFMVQAFPRGYATDARLQEWIGSGDARLVNFEAVVNDGTCAPAAWSGGTWASMDPSVFPDFLSFGFNGCGCANNHSLDFTFDGLRLTQKALRAAKMPHAGIGENLQEATAAAFVDTPAGRVAFVSLNTRFHPDALAGWKTARSPGRPGLNGLRHTETLLVTEEQLAQVRKIAAETGVNGIRELNQRTGFTAPDAPGTFVFGQTAFKVAEKPGRTSACDAKDMKRITDAIREARQKADAVVVLAHSHEIRYKSNDEPAAFFVEFCHAAVEAGADAVIGGGTHELKGIEFHRGKPIFYSLGDFVFQNNVVPLVPPDFCEKYGVAIDADARTAFSARSKGGKVGLHAFRENFLSVVPKIELENGRVVRVSMLPIELHFGADWSLNGLPRTADAEASKTIAATLKRLSEPYGTRIELQEDGTISAVAGGIDRTWLFDMIRIRSETPDVEACNRCLDFVKERLERRGVCCTVVTKEGNGRKALYAATTPGLSHDYVFVSHVDVVPALTEAQYEPRVDGDWLWARGACDTKGNVAVICSVLENLVGRGVSVGAVIVTDEENRDGFEPSPKGLRKAGVRPKKLILVGDSAGEEPGQLFVAEKGHAVVQLVAKGRGGHSSRPWALDNPVPRLCAAWTKVAAALPKPADPDEHWRDVLSPTMLAGGPKPNVIPDEAVMTLSFRYTRPESLENLLKLLRETSGVEVVPPSLEHRRPVLNKPGDPEIAALLSAMRAKWPKESIREGRMSAATDATYFIDLGLPIVIFAATGTGSHGSDERISLSSLDEYAEMFTDYLLRR